jgi:uncharacterized phage-associated protein
MAKAAPYDALTIAKWFIAWAEAEEEELSNLKLHKLLYYAQGHYVTDSGAPLFKDDIQAWPHGPCSVSSLSQLQKFCRFHHRAA